MELQMRVYEYGGLVWWIHPMRSARRFCFDTIHWYLYEWLSGERCNRLLAKGRHLLGRLEYCRQLEEVVARHPELLCF